MSQKQGSSKKKRTPKRSQGINGGGGKVSLTYLEKALISKNFLSGLSAARQERSARENGLGARR